MTRPREETAEDAELWWQAYLLAESDQAGELRERTETGDEHARRQLASWLSERSRTEEAIEVIRPLADADEADEMAALWLARWLADGGHLDELRQRAGTGSYHALEELAGWLAEHDRLAELRELAAGHREVLSGWLARQVAAGHITLAPLAADLGDADAGQRLEAWLARQIARDI
jgi:hypothetical protein